METQDSVTVSGYFVAGVTKSLSAGGKVHADHLQQALEDFCVQDGTLIATLLDHQQLEDCIQVTSSKRMPEALLGLQVDETATCKQTIRPAVRLLTVLIHLVLQQLELAASHAVHQSANSVSKQQPPIHKLSELRTASETCNLSTALPDTKAQLAAYWDLTHTKQSMSSSLQRAQRRRVDLHVSLMALKLAALLGQATVSSAPAVEAALLTVAVQSVAPHAEYCISTSCPEESRKLEADAMHASVLLTQLLVQYLRDSLKKPETLVDAASVFNWLGVLMPDGDPAVSGAVAAEYLKQGTYVSHVKHDLLWNSFLATSGDY